MAKFPKDKDLPLAAMTPPGLAPTPPCDCPDEVVFAEEFVPGAVFAGRYRMITRLGHSDSGDVWHADDMVLQTPVALKVIRSSGAEDRERILAEVRLARQITHPAVRRVFDVGEADGRAFCSMELIQGEDLGTLLRRVGRLPSEKVLDIGEQLCGGLAAAHGQGVLHRDVRPENVLVDEDGLVRLTDFGISATTPDAAGEAASAVSAYTAPEQRSPGGRISERTDLYALGVLLYELLVGRPPSAERGHVAPPPSTIVDDVDPQLERTIMRAIHPDPRRRPASAAAMSVQLSLPVPVARAPVSPWLAGGALAIVLGIIVSLVVIFPPALNPRRAAPLTEQDTIVIADFQNTTGEPVFDGALKVALAVALEQSPFLKVFPDERVRETLQLMQQAPDATVTRALGREIAQREQLKALVAGSIGKLGANYVIALEAVNAATGDVMAREQVEVPRREQVLTSLGDATSRLRAKLGESLALVERFDAPLPRATTSSLEALHSYSLALDQGRVNPRPESIPHLQRALDLDPDFAMAHALLSGVYTNIGRFADAPPHAQRAFELRDRVSERERFFVSWRYYVDATQAWDKALEVAQSWTTTYPREAFAFNSLGMASAAFGEHGRAVAAFREAIRLDDHFVPPYSNLSGSLIALNRLDDARAHLRETAGRGIAGTGTRRAAFTLAFLANDADLFAREIAAARGSSDAIWAPTWEARAAAAQGRFKAAHDFYQRGIELAITADLRDLAAQWTVEDAELEALADRCDEARRRVAAGLAISRNSFALERASRTLALCGAADRVSSLTAELGQRFPEATLTHRVQLPVTAAALALQRGDPTRAVALLDPVKPYDHAPAAEFWPSYLRGQAYLQNKNAAAAAVDFQEITAHQGESPMSPLFALAHLGLARASAAAGHADGARRAYDRFLGLWGGADSDLFVVGEARRESAALR